MSEYNVADMKYWNEYKQETDERCPVYQYKFREEDTLTVQEKINIIDEDNDGFATTILNLAMEYTDDFNNGVIKSEVRYDGGNPVPKTVSYKAWLRRKKNKYGSAMRGVSTDYHVGKIYIGDGDSRWLHHLMTEKSRIEFVNAVFRKVLKKRASQERTYFLEHDEYSVLLKTVSEHLLLRALDFPYIISSRDGLLIGSLEDNRKATLEDLKVIMAKLNELQAVTNQFSAELTASFNAEERSQA